MRRCNRPLFFADLSSFEAEAPTLLPTLRLWTSGCNVAVPQRLKADCGVDKYCLPEFVANRTGLEDANF